MVYSTDRWLGVMLAIAAAGCGSQHEQVSYSPPKPNKPSVQIVVADIRLPMDSPIQIPPQAVENGQPLEIITHVESKGGGLSVVIFRSEGGTEVGYNSAITTVAGGNPAVTLTLNAPTDPGEYGIDLRWFGDTVPEGQKVLVTGKLTTKPAKAP